MNQNNVKLNLKRKLNVTSKICHHGHLYLPGLAVLICATLIFSHLIPVLGEIQNNPSQPKITQISKTKVNSYYLFFFKYCPTQTSNDVKGFLVTSEKVDYPLIVSYNAKSKQCQTYGVKVLTDKPDLVATKLFFKNDIPKLTQGFEVKKKTLEDQFVKDSQKLNNYHRTSASDKKITEQTKKVENLKEMIKSLRSGIILLKSVP